MKIEQIRNATQKIEYGGQTFLIDPWLQDKGTGFSAPAVKEEMVGIKGPLNDLPMPPEEILDDVDFILVTHVHPDHFTQDYLPKDIEIIVPEESDKEKIQKLGFTNVKAFQDNSMKIGNIKITKVAAIHGDNEMIVEKMGDVSGFILQNNEKTLYIAGDTVYTGEIEENIKEFHPEVIVLNCCEATMPSGRLIMNLSEVEEICNNNPETTVVATHLDSVNHALLTSQDLRDLKKEKDLKNLQIPKNGETIEVN